MVAISKEDFEDIFTFAYEHAQEYQTFEDECKIREIYHAIKAEINNGQDVVKLHINPMKEGD